MTQQFQNQGGVANSDPSRLLRWLISRLLRRLVDQGQLQKKRNKCEQKRAKAGQPHTVEYFHQVDDAYSYLAAQVLAPLVEHYEIVLVPHLVAPASGKNAPEPELLLSYARYDASKIAPHYGLQFPEGEVAAPAPDQVQLATRILAGVTADNFAAASVAVGASLWSGDVAAMAQLAIQYQAVDAILAAVQVEIGSDRREQLGHYSGAMFYYGQEWYWGVDRLYHLENRLLSLAAGRGRQLIVPRPGIEAGTLRDNGSLTLEIYPSLRSPYTSIIFDRAVQLAQDTGVTMVIRPVLPMVMRGVPATRQKGWYIFTDTAREARTLGVKWGNFYDPIGEPVRRAYSLYPWAVEHGKGEELLSAFLHAAFYEGINTDTDAGMRHVLERAGLNWQDAQHIIGNSAWEEQLEQNRLAMYGFGSWGVPSFRLLDARGEVVLAVWGQDRLWLVAREIQRLLEMGGASH